MTYCGSTVSIRLESGKEQGDAIVGQSVGCHAYNDKGEQVGIYVLDMFLILRHHAPMDDQTAPPEPADSSDFDEIIAALEAGWERSE